MLKSRAFYSCQSQTTTTCKSVIQKQRRWRHSQLQSTPEPPTRDRGTHRTSVE